MPEKLVDMAMTKAEMKEEKKDMCVGYDGQPNPYPWGLSIRLEDRELKKLGMDKLPEVGSEMKCEIVCRVTSVSQEASETRQAHRCVAMQIVAMGMDMDADEA